MKIRSFWLVVLTLLAPVLLLAQLTFEINQLPGNTPTDATIFLAGDFNTWNPGNTDYTFQLDENDRLSITITPAPGTYGYKLTRGNWATVEGNASGGVRPNRTVTYDGSPTIISIDVLSWEDLTSPNSTAGPNVQILDNAFPINSLNRSRRIWLYLPPDYATSNRSYPVLYMHDGQNLFDLATSFGAEWEVDETLDQLFAEGDQGIIVVGIDNGEGNRLNEYTPWSNPAYGGGQGDAYVDFLVNELKPFIDNNYRTQSGPAHTGIMGSSLGGLISLYAIIKHQNVFGRAGVFSPSLWFTDDIYDFVSNTGKQADVKIYFIAGGSESSTVDVVGDVNNMVQTLQNAGFGDSEILSLSHPEGQHSEWYWAREFGAAYQWLFQELTLLESHLQLTEFELGPNPTSDVLRFQLPAVVWQAKVYDIQGRVQLNQTMLNGQLDVRSLLPGTYFGTVLNEAGEWALFRFIKQ